MRDFFMNTMARATDGSALPDRLANLADFGANPGALRARVYVPARLAERPALVVVLHGCTQTAAGYDRGSGWSQLADRYGFALLYPEQTRANNANLCFNWFEPGDIVRDAGEARSIHQMIGAVVEAHGIDHERIFITGLSAGGAMTSVMLATYPETFASGAIIAGLPYGCASNTQQAFGAMRSQGRSRPDALAGLVRRASGYQGPWPTVSVWHGTSDATVNPDNADAVVAQWLPLHGISGATPTIDLVDGYPHRVWRNAEGQIAVEAYSITGMGHGTPLDTGSPNSFGVPGPHMLDVGISSSRRIAEFWNLTANTVEQPEAAGPTRAQNAKAATAGSNIARRVAPARRTYSDAGPAGRIDVRGIIENALRAGGLMK